MLMGEEDHERLIRAAMSGDQAAFDALYPVESPWMLVKARQLLANRPYACEGPEEAVDDAWLRARGSVTRFQPQSDPIASFCGWLSTILQNYVSERARKREMEINKIEQDCWVLDETAAPGRSPSRLADAAIVSAFLYKCVDELDEPARQIVRLHYFEGVTLSGIGERLNMERSAVNGQLSRARKKLREKMGSSSLYSFA